MELSVTHEVAERRKGEFQTGGDLKLDEPVGLHVRAKPPHKRGLQKLKFRHEINRQQDSGGIYLLDGDNETKLHPKTWEMPSTLRRQQVQVGEYVRVGLTTSVLFKGQWLTESLQKAWVRVVEIPKRSQSDAYRVSLVNTLVGVMHDCMTFGITFYIQPRHMLSVVTPHEMRIMRHASSTGTERRKTKH